MECRYSGKTFVMLVAGFTHQINPILVELGGVRLWFYGAAYALGFMGIWLWFRFRREGIGLGKNDVLDLAVKISLCVLCCGRGFELIVYEWSYITQHPDHLLSFWRGGMASHGVLIGGVLGSWWFCRRSGLNWIRILDELVLPAAFLLAMGRIGNFINGQIFGPETSVWWGVQFPGTDVYRHPVTLYEALKNLALIPILLWVAKRGLAGRGHLVAHFVFWYGFLRIFTDCFREYGGTIMGIGTGQYFNLLMAGLGLVMIVQARKLATTPSRSVSVSPSNDRPPKTGSSTWLKRILFAFLLALAMTIPSGWSMGVLQEARSTQAELDQNK